MREIGSAFVDKGQTSAAAERLYVATQRFAYADNAHDCAWLCEPIYSETSAVLGEKDTPPNRVADLKK